MSALAKRNVTWYWSFVNALPVRVSRVGNLVILYIRALRINSSKQVQVMRVEVRLQQTLYHLHQQLPVGWFVVQNR